MDAADRLDGQIGDMLRVAFHEPLEAVAQAHHLCPGQAGADGGRADDTVDTGSGATAHDDSHVASRPVHLFSPFFAAEIRRSGASYNQRLERARKLRRSP